MKTETQESKRGFNPFDLPEINQLFEELISSLFDESGRGAILIATAHVDNHLTKLIEAAFPKNISKNHKEKLFSYPGQLSSFSSKIELSYVFRLISKSLYNSLNALRKIRNDAAHKHSKFELHELIIQLKPIYELGTGFPEYIREMSAKSMILFKIEAIKSSLHKDELSEIKNQKRLEEIFNKKETIEILEKQLPFWELIIGLSFLCGLLAYNKQRIAKLTKDINTFSDLVKDE